MATRYNQAQIDKIRARNAGKAVTTESPVTKVQTSGMSRSASPQSVMQTGVVTDKGIVKTPITNVASNAPISVPKVTGETPMKPTYVPTRQAKQQYWDLVNQQQRAGQFDAGTQVRMADEAQKQAATETGQIRFDTAGLFGEQPSMPTTQTPTSQQRQQAPVAKQAGAQQGQQDQGETMPTQQAETPQGVIGGMPDITQAKTAEEAAMMAGGGMTAAANQYLQQGQQMAAETFSVAEDARRLDMISALNATNAREIADTMGVKLENMTTAQLEQLSVSSGLTPDKDVINRIKEEGSLAIDDIRMERGDVLAENKFVRDQTERIFDRALDDRERFNAAQDVKLKNAMATLGGGTASQGSLVEVMAAQEQGKRALEDLSKEYAGRVDAIGRQAQAIVREYGAMERQINAQVADAVEAKYAEMQNTLKELRKQGVTNKKDLNAAIMPLMKEYVSFYNDAVKWQADQMFDLQKEANDQAERLFRRQFDSDKEMSQQTGFVYQNGQLLTDDQGNPVPTMDFVKFQTTEQRLQSQFERELGFKMSQEEFDQKMQAARFSQDKYEFEQTTGLRISEQVFQELKFQAELADKGLEFGVVTNTQQATPSFNPAKSVYGVIPTDSGIQINAPYTGNAANGTAVLRSGRRQCGEYVNDVIGIPSYFEDSFASKAKRVTTQVPSPGSAFVLNVKGVPHGHVGIVEEIYPDGTLLISESNAEDNEKFFRGRVTMDNLRRRGLVGFTEGLMTQKKIQKMTSAVMPTAGGVTQQRLAPGMSISGKPLTEGQAKSKTYADMMENAMRDFSSVENRIQQLATEFGGFFQSFYGAMPNALKGEEIQRQQQAQYAFGDAYLRYTTGATATPDEIRRAGERFFPQPGDSINVIQQKKRDREETARSIREASGTLSTFTSKGTGMGIPQGLIQNFYRYTR